MAILKGVFLGLWLFGFGTIAFLYFSIYRHLPTVAAGTAVSVDARSIAGRTTHNVWWYVALVACIALGLALVRSWPGNGSTMFWVFLVVTSVIPAGVFSLFAFMASKLKAVAGGMH